MDRKQSYFCGNVVYFPGRANGPYSTSLESCAGIFLPWKIQLQSFHVMDEMYIFSISELGKPVGNIDYGSIVGSYLGLLFLSAAYAAIGLFTSTISKNQIVAFILSVFIVFILYYGFDALANSFQQTRYTIQLFGIHEHYKSISRGVIDTRDLVYFFSVIIFFLFLTKHRITNE